MMKAVLLVSHGSRSPKTTEEMAALAGILRRRMNGVAVEYAFLEIATPSIPEGIDKCASQGATFIVVALNFLNAGRHVNEDIPAIVEAARKKYPHVRFTMTGPVGQHPLIPGLFIDLINNASS